MDTLTFITKLIDSLAWPIVIAGSIYLMRVPLSSLLPRIDKLKYKDLEADFSRLSVSDQSLLFLDGVARKEKWTFYESARKGERPLGAAFAIIVRDLLNVERNEIIEKLRQWLNSENENVVWFAAEIIGYFKVYELKDEISEAAPQNPDRTIPESELNVLWAQAMLTDFENLNKFFQKTTSQANQEWILFLYQQMPEDDNFTLDYRVTQLENFADRKDVSKAVIKKALAVLQKLKSTSN